MYLKNIIVLKVKSECKMEKGNSQLEQGQQIEAFFARATQVWLAVNHNTIVISGE